MENLIVESIPILRMGNFLLVTIQVDMHDRLAMTLQDDLTSRISDTGAKGVLIDISALDVVDSFIGRMLANIAQMSRILDAETVVTGMRPAVAITLVELGMTLTGVKTALSVERGMQMLQTALAQRDLTTVDGEQTDEEEQSPYRRGGSMGDTTDANGQG
ncbi:MAG TPA: STAS domain-containing protein [Humisphaera sp.]|nr:STAS domain-containing protein [Humisphaera sp.]